MSEDTTAEDTQVQEAAPVEAAPAVQPKVKAKTGDLILDTAHEVEGMTSKTKALNAAEKLRDAIEGDYFKLGGILRLIKKEQWYDGFPTFYAYVGEKFGFAGRKADYLIEIYENLTDKQIPWDLVQHLGWTKLKDLAKVLTQDTLDEWITKATELTVTELQAVLKAGNGPTAEVGSAKTTSDSVVLKFKLHTDQAEHIQTALAKAKGEMSTDHDNVALDAICTGYLAGASAVEQSVDPKALFQQMGWQGVLGLFDELFPNVNLEVDAYDTVEEAQAAQAAKAATSA